MGRFVLTGPDYIISKKFNPYEKKCRCRGLRMEISEEIESVFLDDDKISRVEFLKLINTTEHIGNDAIFYYEITDRKKQVSVSK